MALFDRNDVEKSFTRTIVIRGNDYLRTGQVAGAWFDDDGKLHGQVKGSEPQPYRVEIGFSRRAGFVALDSACTCPYSYQCKHAVAVALYALKHGIPQPDITELALQPREGHSDVPEFKFRIPKASPVPPEIPLSMELKSWLDSLSKAVSADPAESGVDNTRVFYNLKTKQLASSVQLPTVTVFTRSVLKSGEFGAWKEVRPSSISPYIKAKGWTNLDWELILDLNSNAPKVDYNRPEYKLDGKHGIRLLRELLATGRCIWNQGGAFQLGSPRHGTLGWEATGKRGAIQPKIDIEGGGKPISTVPIWYLDLKTYECGPVECGVAPEIAKVFATAAAIPPEHIEDVRKSMSELGLEQIGLPISTLTPIVRAPDPTPCLKVDFESCQKDRDYWTRAPISAPVAFAKLTFEYEGHTATVDGSDVRFVEGDQIVILRRNVAAESIAREFLDSCGWVDTKYCGWEIPKGRGNHLCMVPPDASRLLDPLERVAAFAKNVAPNLTEAGWRIELEQNYRFVPDSDVEWNVGLDAGSGIDWFEFQLGIKVEGKQYDLRPMLASLFREFGNSGVPTGAIARTHKSDDLFIFGGDGQVIRLSRQRLSAILQPLVEIFGAATEWPSEFKMPKSLLHEAGSFEDTLEEAGVPWKTTEELSQLRKKFVAFDHLDPILEPQGFVGELRGYQREGLAWLQFLREYRFGGILADDMGLGKTVQVLAHIQAEKDAGRMDRPCLIVAPTSTIPNWRRECERFVPQLKVLTLQGAGRQGRFSDLNEVDIALTTYPLIARDKGVLQSTLYHIIVLDEAQNIKNASTGAAKAARDLQGRHKLCMSGTPVENHLGELWSLFQFLMPGFLGSDPDFKKRFRTPIEKLGDTEARDRLARRIRPFMLRRTKAQVVKELPPKTQIIESVAFDDPQRDLYESIRLAMDEQVRHLIAEQGFEKSRFQILDALLKLRQVCCDPRLVKLPSARLVESSAKLDRLLEMLGVLLEDGRKVLLFSQFTSMLNLIEERLKAANMSWVRISGDTIDRETPVQRFQAGEVPLFLISLKAGGTGLNLTAADTVILYDPWWNPAVENQAIDRAHRIGQDKAVIVYKLVAAGTIEEKMLEMQERKADIARGILTEDADSIRTLTAEDLQWVFA